MIIRQMTINDYEEVVRLWERTPGIGISEADSKDRLEIFLKRNPCLNMVCQVDNRIIGTILCGCDGRRGYIYHTAVEKKYKLRGIAAELVKEALKRLRAAGIDKCHLFVFSNNEDGQEFWSAVGWDRREDLLVYSKSTEEN